MLPPAQLSSDQLQAFLYHLVLERKLSPSTCNVAINALRLYYQLVEGVPRDQLGLMLPRARTGWRLPEVLSMQEVERLIAHARQPHHRTFLMTVYGAGWRLAEAINLRARHIDSDRMQIYIEAGKGNKDRYTVLSSAHPAHGLCQSPPLRHLCPCHQSHSAPTIACSPWSRHPTARSYRSGHPCTAGKNHPEAISSAVPALWQY